MKRKIIICERKKFREKKEYLFEFSKANEKTELKVFVIDYFKRVPFAIEVNKGNWKKFSSPGDKEFIAICYASSHSTCLSFMFVLIKDELIPLSLFFNRHIDKFGYVIPDGYSFYIEKQKGLPLFILKEQEWLNYMHRDILNDVF